MEQRRRMELNGIWQLQLSAIEFRIAEFRITWPTIILQHCQIFKMLFVTSHLIKFANVKNVSMFQRL